MGLQRGPRRRDWIRLETLAGARSGGGLGFDLAGGGPYLQAPRRKITTGVFGSMLVGGGYLVSQDSQKYNYSHPRRRGRSHGWGREFQGARAVKDHDVGGLGTAGSRRFDRLRPRRGRSRLNAACGPESSHVERPGVSGNGRSFKVERSPRCRGPTLGSTRYRNAVPPRDPTS